MVVTASAPLITARGVWRKYPGVVALKDFDLDLFPGEVVAICGANGAGKSTFARLLSGQEPTSAGEIRINGREEPIRSQRDAFESGILMLHQEPLVVDDFTVGENVWLYSLRTGYSNPLSTFRETGDVETRRALETVGLAGLSTSRLGSTLAPGQRQMLALTRALVNDHRVLILDESTASTTETFFELVKSMVARERATGTCVLFVSHRMQEVFDIADRIVILRNGSLVKILRTRETNVDEVTSLMIGDALKVMHRPPHDPDPYAAPVLQVDALSAGSASDVSFSVKPGEIIGLYGLVGSGRSSIARGISGHQPILSGTVKISRRTPNLHSPRTALREGIAYVSENRRLDGFVPDFTNGENLTLSMLQDFSHFGVLNLARERSSADELVERFDVKGTSRTMTANLSGGNQQKVCIAKWIAANPEVIVFDEPTKGIDVGARANIYEMIFNLAQSGKSVVVVSSEGEEVLLLTHRVLVLREGHVVAELDAGQATLDDLVRPALGAKAS